MLDDLFAGRGQRPAVAAAFTVAVVMEYILANVAARLTRMALLGITGGTGTPFSGANGAAPDSHHARGRQSSRSAGRPGVSSRLLDDAVQLGPHQNRQS